MAKWYLLNTTKFSSVPSGGGPALPVLLYAGQEVDDTLQSLAPIQAAGGVLAPSTNAAVAAAAAVAQQMQQGGQAVDTGALDRVMLAAAAGIGATSQRKTSSALAGATVAAAAAIVPDVSFTPSFSGKLLVRAWASIEALSSGTFTPVLKVGGTTVAAPAQYTGAAGAPPSHVMVEVEVDSLAVGTATTIHWATTAGDATVTLGNGLTGAGAGVVVEEKP